MAALVLGATAANAAEIRLVPGDVVIAQPANRGRGYSDLMVHAVAIRAGSGERFMVEAVEIALLSGGEPVLRHTIDGRQLLRDTAELASAPLPAFVAGQLLDRGGLAGLFDVPTEPAAAPLVEPGQALAATRLYYAYRGAVDGVRVTLRARGPDGEVVGAERLVPVRAHESPIDYRPPLRGTWLMQAVPTLQSHHRFNPSTEFALDFFRVDAEGRLTAGDALRAEDAYGYGADVLAAADGEVVRVVDGETQDPAALTRRPDESPQAAGERIAAHMMARMARDFERAVAGNLVVIRHERNGVTEYSSYGHLRAGITVRVGQRVAQGAVVGRVGDTGDSPAVHLHFQVNAGPDPFASPSLPVRLAGLRAAAGNAELGRFVVAD